MYLLEKSFFLNQNITTLSSKWQTMIWANYKHGDFQKKMTTINIRKAWIYEVGKQKMEMKDRQTIHRPKEKGQNTTLKTNINTYIAIHTDPSSTLKT